MSTIQELQKSYVEQYRNGAKLGKNKTIRRVCNMVMHDEMAKIIRMVNKGKIDVRHVINPDSK